MSYAVFDRTLSNIAFTFNVGIGTTVALARLHVQGNSYVSGNLGIGSTNPTAPFHLASRGFVTGSVGFGTTTPQGSLDVNVSSTSNAFLITQRGLGGAMNVSTTATPNALVVNNNGYVGVGTTAPVVALHVEGNNVVSGNIGIGTNTPLKNVSIFHASAESGVRVQSGGGTDRAELYLASKVADKMAVGYYNQPLHIGRTTNGTNVTGTVFPTLVMTTADNVGMGTSTPLEKLHVIGNILASGTVTASNLNILGDFVTLNTTTSNTEQMVVNNAGTGPALKVIQSGANTVAEFYDSETSTPSLFIANGGNVGIGTSNPLTKLHVIGEALISQGVYELKLSGTLDSTKTESWYRLLALDEKTFTSVERAVCGLTIQCNGLHYSLRFGVNPIFNTASTTGSLIDIQSQECFIGREPILKLRVVEESSSVKYLDMYINHDVVDVTRTWNVVLRVFDGAGASSPTTFLEKITTTPTTSYEYDISNMSFAIYTRNSGITPIVLSTQGNIGIGTTNPLNPLHVNGNTRMDGALEIRAVAPTIAFYETDSALDEKYSFFSQNNSTIIGYLANDANNLSSQWLNVTRSNIYVNEVKFYTNQTNERMRIAKDGNVGIGTTNPQAKLHVLGDVIMASARYPAYSALNTANVSAWYQLGTFTFNSVGVGETCLITIMAGAGFDQATTTTTLPTDKTAIGYIYLRAGNAGGNANQVNMSGYFWKTGQDEANARAFMDAVKINTTQTVATATSWTVYIRTAAFAGFGGLKAETSSASTFTFNISVNSTTSTFTAVTGTTYDLKSEYVVGVGAATRALLINDAGNVGIGTTTVQSPLHVVGGDIICQYSTTPSIILQRNASGYGGTGTDFKISNNAGTRLSVFQNRTATGETELFSVTNGGNVGIGTATPSSRLDIGANTSTNEVVTIRSQNYAGIQIIGDSVNTAGEPGGAYTYYSLDGDSQIATIGMANASGIDSKGTTVTNSLGNAFILNTSTIVPLQFATSNNVAMTISAGGLVGIGTANPQSQFHLGTGNIRVTGITSSGSAGTAVHVDANNQMFKFTSDGRYKVDRTPLISAESIVQSLNPIQYRSTTDNGRGIGLIAQEVAEVAPHLHNYNPTDDIHSVDYHGVNMYVLKALQGVLQRLDALEQRINQ